MPDTTTSSSHAAAAAQCGVASSQNNNGNLPIDMMIEFGHVVDESSSETIRSTLSSSAGDGSSSNNSFASQMIPRLSQLPSRILAALDCGTQIQDAIHQAIRPVLWDMIILAIIGWALVPLARIIYNVRYHPRDKRKLLTRKNASNDLMNNQVTTAPTAANDSEKPNTTLAGSEYATSTVTTTIAAAKSETKQDDDPFGNHVSYFMADTMSQLVRLMILVYMFDAVLIATQALGMDILHEEYKSATFAKIIYTIWLSWRVRSWKRYWLALAVRRPRDRLGKALLWDRLLDVLILVSFLVSIMGLLHLDVGPGLTSVFAFGGVGTLIFSLASKDLAAQIVTAMVLSTSDKFHVGEQVKFGDGTTGIVARMGWLTTDIRGFDNITTRIPNASLANLRCANISRENMARVVFNLRFSYHDIDKLPALMKGIKAEIAASCPQLVTDGSRPFRVLWQDMMSDCVIVNVTTHFQNMKPSGSKYCNNKQEVLFAIHRAVRKNDMHYVLPSYQVATTISNPQQQQHDMQLRPLPNNSSSPANNDD